MRKQTVFQSVHRKYSTDHILSLSLQKCFNVFQKKTFFKWQCLEVSVNIHIRGHSPLAPWKKCSSEPTPRWRTRSGLPCGTWGWRCSACPAAPCCSAPAANEQQSCSAPPARRGRSVTAPAPAEAGWGAAVRPTDTHLGTGIQSGTRGSWCSQGTRLWLPCWERPCTGTAGWEARETAWPCPGM